MSSIAWDLGIGAVIGYGASRVTDQASGWHLEHQSEASRQREEEIAPGSAPVVAGKKFAGLVGRDVTDAEAARIGLFVHRSLGVTYGMAAAALVRAGTPPIWAGIVTGAAAFLLVDEGFNSAALLRRRGLIRSRATRGESSGTLHMGSSLGSCSPSRVGSGR
jgi:hypothetical protein